VANDGTRGAVVVTGSSDRTARVWCARADDSKALGCSYDKARQLLTAALANDKAAVRRLERGC